MKKACIILLSLISLTGWSQTRRDRTGKPHDTAATCQPGGSDSYMDTAAVDRLKDRALVCQSPDGDSAVAYLARALEECRKSSYIHGTALFLACQAVIMKEHPNDFMEMERLSRASLGWFARTENKDHITIAYYQLGFALFAQSRFNESLQYLETGYRYAAKTGDRRELIRILSLMGCARRERGDYDTAFDISRQCLEMAARINDAGLTETEYFELAELFIRIEDYGSAEKYFHMGFQVGKPGAFSPWAVMVYAELLTHQKKYDSALYYYDHFDTAVTMPVMMRTYLVSKGEYYLFREKYAGALPYFLKSLQYQRLLNDRNQVMRCLQDLSRTYMALGQDERSLHLVHESLTMAREANSKQYIRDGSQILYTLYDKEKRTDSAYLYYRGYISMKDSILNDQSKGKFASYAYEQKISLLKKEKEIQEVCLREELFTRKILIGGIVVLLLASFIFSRNVLLKRKNEACRRERAETELEIQHLEGERSKAALRQRAKELEIQALRSQMNPHFIFNCLNAINRFILGHETEAASDYLTKFSRLMRMIMNHSRHSLITLADELEVLQLYLDMERLRFKNSFDYEIRVEGDTEAGDIYIPPLLMQPFVENAIWHGLMHKEERGQLSVVINTTGNILTGVISDNGIGRRRAQRLKSKSAEKHKSMGLQITAERLALLTGKGGADHFFRIEDICDRQGDEAGTRVTLTIPVNTHMKESVAG